MIVPAGPMEPLNGPTTGIHISSDRRRRGGERRSASERCGRRIHHPGMCVTMTTRLNASAGDDRRAQARAPEYSRPSPTEPATTTPEWRADQRRQEVAEHHVLQHVHRVQVLLAES